MPYRLAGLLMCLLIISSGCAISTKNVIPYEVAISVTEYQQRLLAVVPGMTLSEVENILSRESRTKPINLFSTPNVRIINQGNEKACLLYSCSAQLSEKQAETVRGATIFEIPYADLTEKARPDLVDTIPGAQFRTIGSDAKAFLVFETQETKLVLIEVIRPDQITKDEIYTETIFGVMKRAIDGSASQAGKEAIKAIAP